MNTLDAFAPVDVNRMTLDSAPVSDELREEGAPRTGSQELGRISGAPVGVWEMTAGVMRDIEVDEVFVVISGAATVELLEDGSVVRSIALYPGVLCRLAAGMRTRWTVPDALRKVYILGRPDAAA